MSALDWNPEQYQRFRRQRRRPFFDLLRGVRRRPGLRVVDLGCGTGELTARLARWLPGSTVVGVDSSEAMIAKARPLARARLSFRQEDVQAMLAELGPFDVVFSNAALHWVDDHRRFFGRLLDAMPAGAQLAVQMPKNDEHPSHRLVPQVAGEPAFREALGEYVRASPVLPAECYLGLMHARGWLGPRAVERVYSHPMPSVDAIVEWTRGTTLLPYLGRLDAQTAERFVADYRRRLVEAMGGEGPCVFTFRRLFLWGRAPG